MGGKNTFTAFFTLFSGVFMTICVLGGDRRMCYAAEMLAEKKVRVLGFGLQASSSAVSSAKTAEEALRDADIVLLPIPLSRDGVTLNAPALTTPIPLTDILQKTSEHTLLFGGMANGFSHPRLFDYGARSDFAVRNAVPTAEGALMLAIGALPCTISGMNLAVIGFGKIGKATAALFKAAGANVTVFARRDETVAVASLLGYTAASLAELHEHAADMRCLINTVPAPVVGDGTLCRMRKDALLLELASAPYGIDFEIARARELKTIIAGGLPGKYSPESAGYAIAETVCAMLAEKGLLP